MKIEFNTLTKEFDCWEYVLNIGKNILPSTWVFKTNDTQMDESRSSRPGFVHREIGSRMASDISRPGLKLFDGQWYGSS
jgi:hypothetical protein